MSCCGRGGSWFKHCGTSGNQNLHHTWYEGIQACQTRTQVKTAIGDAAQQKHIDSSNGASNTNSKSVIIVVKPFASTPTVTTPIIVPVHASADTPAHTSDGTSMTTGVYEKLRMTVHTVSLLFVLYACGNL